MDKRVPVKTIYLLLVISVGLIGLAFGSTFAMFEANVTIDNPISISSNLTYSDEVLQTISVNLESLEEKEITLNLTNDREEDMYYNVWYVDENNSVDFGTESDTSGIIGGMDTITLRVEIRNNLNKTINIVIGSSVSSDSTTSLDENMTLIQKRPMPEKIINENLVQYITNLYNNAPKKVVTNNSIDYHYSNDDDVVEKVKIGLMNDRLGGTTEDLDGGNIRYYGENPHNYIYFNCDDYDSQDSDSCEVWRIIGIFNGKVKIVRNETIGDYSWDNKDTTTGAESVYGKNDWTSARLMRLLNPSDYYEVDTNDNGYGQSLYYNSESGTCFAGKNNATKLCDFESTGLKNNTTKNIIEEVTWTLGSNSNGSVYPDQIYSYERGTSVYKGRPTTWTGKIALMYPSDYGYAADLSKCKDANDIDLMLNKFDTNINNYQCRSNDWIYRLGSTSWLLSAAINSNDAFFISTPSGTLYTGKGAYPGYNVYPTLYLDTGLIVSSGEGTINKPYRLSIN